MNNTVASTASILMKTGACVGGTIIGYLSQWVGRRRAMCVAALISACLIPAWVLPNKFGSLAASGFMLQFFVQGAWGASPLPSKQTTLTNKLIMLTPDQVIPIHLNELSPPAFRSTFPGRKSLKIT
jgi:MFS family permease